jgi:hypothetical protein
MNIVLDRGGIMTGLQIFFRSFPHPGLRFAQPRVRE